MRPHGSQRWITGGKTIGSPQSHIAPGDIGCFRRIAGTTHDCVVINDFMEGPWPLTSYVWDRDGLWVGGVMDKIDRKAAPVWRYGAGGESLGTTLVNDPKTGDVLLYWHGLNELRIGKVTGWEGWERKSGKVQLVAAAATKPPMLTEVPPGTGKGLQLEFWDQRTLTTTRPRQRIASPASSWDILPTTRSSWRPENGIRSRSSTTRNARIHRRIKASGSGGRRPAARGRARSRRSRSASYTPR